MPFTSQAVPCGSVWIPSWSIKPKTLNLNAKIHLFCNIVILVQVVDLSKSRKFLLGFFPALCMTRTQFVASFGFQHNKKQVSFNNHEHCGLFVNLPTRFVIFGNRTCVIRCCVMYSSCCLHMGIIQQAAYIQMWYEYTVGTYSRESSPGLIGTISVKSKVLLLWWLWCVLMKRMKRTPPT